MTTISQVARGFWAEKRCRPVEMRNAKYLKLLYLLFLGGSTLGCASSQATAFDRQLLVELEEKNVRLEAEVTRLREEKLHGDRKSDCLAGDGQEATSESDGPEPLPVVEMSPPAPEEELAAGDAMIRPAEPPAEEEPIDDDTRPVLKVRGKHEAWVYHRAVTAEDRKAKTDPASESKTPPEESK